jgi:polyhydroxyalkanoate synthesis regulator phasin
MSSRPLVDFNSVKNVLQGFAGALAFCSYHQVNVNKIMELNDYKHKVEINELHNKYRIEINEIHMNHKLEMDIYRNEINLYRSEIQNLTKKIEKLEKRWW